MRVFLATCVYLLLANTSVVAAEKVKFSLPPATSQMLAMAIAVLNQQAETFESGDYETMACSIEVFRPARNEDSLANAGNKIECKNRVGENIRWNLGEEKIHWFGNLASSLDFAIKDDAAEKLIRAFAALWEKGWQKVALDRSHNFFNFGQDRQLSYELTGRIPMLDASGRKEILPVLVNCEKWFTNGVLIMRYCSFLGDSLRLLKD